MAEIVCTKTQVLRFILSRQGLIERLPRSQITNLGVLHSTNQTTPYLSLLARIQDFDRKNFLEMCQGNNNKELYRFRCMRGTLHLVPKNHITFFRSCYCTTEESLPMAFKYFDLNQAKKVKKKALSLLRENGLKPLQL